MADTPAVLSFMPWLRRGLATGIVRPDGGSAGVPDNDVAVTLTLNAGTANTQLSLVEPGDIVGLDTRAIVRTFPHPNESDAEFRHLVMIELDQADLPWRYTPAAANADQLRPWLTLVVLIDQTEVTITPPTPSQKLATATVPQNVLPDLSQAWAWAHVQVHGSTSADAVPGTLRGTPGQFVARIVSNRVLVPNTAYQALLVPTYERGRLIGTGGEPGMTDALRLAWDSSKADPVQLPIYYQWSFHTGSVGSFEDLVRALTPRQLPETVGRRPMDVTVPGLGLPQASATPLGVEGALQSLAAAANPPAWDPTQKTTWTTALANVLNFSVANVQNNVRLVVTPPLYGRWHAAQTKLDASANQPWLFDLNDDPRLRVAAANGTAVVQSHDQELMASAWQQIGSLKSINDERRVLQTARETFSLGYGRFATNGNPSSFLWLMGPLHARVLSGTSTIFTVLAGSRIGRAVFDPMFRRLARPSGKIGRLQGRPTAPGSITADFLSRLNDGRLDPAPEPGPPGGMITWAGLGGTLVPGNLPAGDIPGLTNLGRDALTFWGLLFFCVARTQLLVAKNPGRKWWWLLRMMRFGLGLIKLAQSSSVITRLGKLRDGKLAVSDVKSPPAIPGFTAVDSIPGNVPLPTIPPANGTDSADATAFRNAFSDLLGRLGVFRPARPVGATVDLTGIFNTLVSALSPGVTVPATMVRRINIDPNVIWQNPDPLEPIMPAPEFPQPMYLPLRDLSSEWIVPGLAQIKPDTLAVLLTNQRFVEAYMVGLSHEMARELLWNEYPTDQRGTYFRQFWDTRGYVTAPGETFNPAQFRDINPITSWPKTAQLGANSPRRTPPGGQHLVLLVRGELIHRYPNVIVYAARSTDVNAVETHPVFSGRIGSDVAFYGFELTTSDASGNPGWFFVLQEQPAEPRLRPPDAAQGHPYVTVADAANAATGAQFAANLLQQPTRVAVHGSALIPPQP